jgi:hypothetical protein
MVCPRCDNQGLIYRANILNLGIELSVFDECDACWPKNQPLRIDNFKDLTVFLEEHKLTYESSEIEDLGYVDFTEEERRRTFFDTPRDEILALIDEAWLKKGDPLASDPGVYVTDMKRIIGTNGETAVTIIVKPGTAEIRTAYPVKM